jgi:hypothetical protein
MINLEEIAKRMQDIPFENSCFQNENFVIGDHATPARQYRAICLRISSKLNAVKELKYNRELEQIKLDKWNYQLTTDIDEFKKRKLQAKITHKLETREYTDKLLNDALVEIDFLYNKLVEYPVYTREQFELEEYKYFEAKLLTQITTGNNGSLISLKNMNSPLYSQLATNTIKQQSFKLLY